MKKQPDQAEAARQATKAIVELVATSAIGQFRQVIKKKGLDWQTSGNLPNPWGLQNARTGVARLSAVEQRLRFCSPRRVLLRP